MRFLVLVPDQDTPGKKDVTHAFLPEARAFCRHYGVSPEEAIKRFPANATPDQRRAVSSLAIKATGAPVDVVAMFCHGWKAGVQAGWLRQHALLLARLLSVHLKSPGYLLLYACETGRDLDDDADDDRVPGPGGDGGFADAVRDSCEALGRAVTVVGHTTAGHTSMNPWCRYFAPGCGGKGGHWFVEPKSALWPLWQAALRDPKSSLRYRFWSMTPDEIADELRGGLPPKLVA